MTGLTLFVSIGSFLFPIEVQHGELRLRLVYGVLSIDGGYIGWGMRFSFVYRQFSHHDLTWFRYRIVKSIFGSGTLFSFDLALWVVFVGLTTVSGALSLVARRSQKPGHCCLCGYDLTGNTSGTCPECGSAVPGRAADSAGAVPPTERNEQD